MPTHGGMARLSWPGWLVIYWGRFSHTGRWSPDTVTHPSTNGVQHRLTSLIETNTLTTMPNCQPSTCCAEKHRKEEDEEMNRVNCAIPMYYVLQCLMIVSWVRVSWRFLCALGFILHVDLNPRFSVTWCRWHATLWQYYIIILLIFNFWHLGPLALSLEHHSARMSKLQMVG